MSERLDAMIRVFALYSLRRLRSKNAYNAEKHANDVLDHDLLRYLAYPAAICTRDSGIHADLLTTSARHCSWVLKPDELAAPDILDRLRAVHF
jgi:hypothetical protein